MEKPELARMAGHVFSVITGVNLATENLEAAAAAAVAAADAAAVASLRILVDLQPRRLAATASRPAAANSPRR